MKVEETGISGVKILTPARFVDDRGFFSELWNRNVLFDAGITCDFVQDNHSMSYEVNTIRGLHYQAPPHPQAKLVRCSKGRIFDVAVDVRKGSPTFGKWVGVDLSFENGKQLFLPEGCLHGFITRAPNCEVAYKCSGFYSREYDGAVRWNDPDIGVDWGLTEEPVLSDKDTNAPLFSEFETPFQYTGPA